MHPTVTLKPNTNRLLLSLLVFTPIWCAMLYFFYFIGFPWWFVTAFLVAPFILSFLSWKQSPTIACDENSLTYEGPGINFSKIREQINWNNIQEIHIQSYNFFASHQTEFPIFPVNVTRPAMDRQYWMYIVQIDGSPKLYNLSKPNKTELKNLIDFILSKNVKLTHPF